MLESQSHFTFTGALSNRTIVLIWVVCGFSYFFHTVPLSFFARFLEGDFGRVDDDLLAWVIFPYLDAVWRNSCESGDKNNTFLHGAVFQEGRAMGAKQNGRKKQEETPGRGVWVSDARHDPFGAQLRGTLIESLKHTSRPRSVSCNVATRFFPR